MVSLLLFNPFFHSFFHYSTNIGGTGTNNRGSGIKLLYIHQVLLDPRTNWICPVSTFVNECYACTYYGHRLNYCPKISLDAGNLCVRYWENRHDRDRDSCQKLTLPWLDWNILLLSWTRYKSRSATWQIN